MKKIIFIFIYIVSIVILIPALIVYMLEKLYSSPENEIKILPEYETKEELSEAFDLEQYIVSVVSAEMPASYELEALKAQAVAARTYALYHADSNGVINPNEIGQAFETLTERQKKWGVNFSLYEDRLQQAVLFTKGEILTYNGEEIEAVFHAVSAGKTEASENAWNTAKDYLITVDSSFDENSPMFLSEERVLLNIFLEQCIKQSEGFMFSPSEIVIKERSKAGYVLSIQIGNTIFKGSEIRNMFGLRSACFDVSIEENPKVIVFSVKGYGHGAGMSQYGANELAKSGSGYKEILAHYYTDTIVQQYINNNK